MIQPLRRRHLWMTSLVFLFTLAVFLIGRNAADPHLDEKPFPVSAAEAVLEDEMLVEEGVFVALPEARYRLFRGAGENGSVRIEVSMQPNHRRPPLLGLWQPTPGGVEEQVRGSVLLGKWGINTPTSFVLPDSAAVSPGALVLFDEAKEEIVATLSLNQ